MTDDGTDLMTIGELARTTGLTVRTIRYWSDEGALPPHARSAGGYRLYDAESVARLELIRTLRELGLGLDAVRRVLAGETTVAQVAAAHVSALDAQIGSLRVTRAVLSTVARRGSTAEEFNAAGRRHRARADRRRRPGRRTRTPDRGGQRPARPLPGTVGDRERPGAALRPRGAVQVGGRRAACSDGRII